MELAPDLDHFGEIPREDVALVLAEALETESTIGKSFDLLGGDVPAAEAVRAL